MREGARANGAVRSTKFWEGSQARDRETSSAVKQSWDSALTTGDSRRTNIANLIFHEAPA